MEFDLDAYLGSDLPADRSVEPSNTGLTVAVSNSTPQTNEAEGRSRRVSRRLQRLTSKAQAGPFTGGHPTYGHLAPPEWNLGPAQYGWYARRDEEAVDGVRTTATFAAATALGGPTSIWLSFTEPGFVAAIPDGGLAFMFMAGALASIGALIAGPSAIFDAREIKKHDLSVLGNLDPAQAINTQRLPYEVSNLLAAIANGENVVHDDIPPATPERYQRLEVAYRLGGAMVAAIETDPSLAIPIGEDPHAHWYDTPLVTLYRLCPDELRELIDVGLALGEQYTVSIAGSLQGQVMVMDRTDGRPSPSVDPPQWPSSRPSNPPSSSAGAVGGTLAHRWEAALAAHDKVVEAWTAIVTDPLAALDHSLLLDVTQPRTAAFIEAYGHAQDLRALHGANMPSDSAQQVAYFAAVRKTDEAWTEAARYAKHVHLSWLPEGEAKRVRQASGFLAQAGDESLTLLARSNAAAKAAELLAKVTSFLLPPMAMHALEASRRLALPTPAES